MVARAVMPSLSRGSVVPSVTVTKYVTLLDTTVALGDTAVTLPRAARSGTASRPSDTSWPVTTAAASDSCTGSTATSAIPGTTTSTSTVARPGGTQFMVISKAGPLVAVLPVQESDAAGHHG